jgi:hypothetical protein
MLTSFSLIILLTRQQSLTLLSQRGLTTQQTFLWFLAKLSTQKARDVAIIPLVEAVAL